MHKHHLAAKTAAMQIRATLRNLIEADPENVAETLAGALAEITTRQIAAYGPEGAARLCERAAALARSAPRTEVN